MNRDNAENLLTKLKDGQTLSVTVTSGTQHTGVYNAAKSSIDGGLFWEDHTDHEFLAKWDNIKDVSFRAGAGVSGGRFVVPSEHPLAQPDARLKAYTTRNR